MQAIFSITLVVLCINVGIYFVGNLMGIGTLQNASIDPEDLNSNFQNQTEQLEPAEGGLGIISTLVVGLTDAIEFLEGVFAGGWIVQQIELLCMNCEGLEYFTVPLQSVLLLLNIIGIVGLIRGINII